MVDDRHIQIGGDADGNIVITGDSNVVNVVILQTSRRLEPEPVAPAIGPNPYQGLSAFTEKDADRFFGREKLTRHLWTVFRDLHEPQPGKPPPLRLLPILGPSGSGKSSVARAGLIPELAHQPLPGLQTPRVAVFTPGAHPLEALAAILARLATKDPAPVAKAREFVGELTTQNVRGEFDGLRRVAEALPDIATSTLILLVDQFEEIYSLCDDPSERDSFVYNLLHTAADRAAHVSVILTLRSDFLGQTQWHPALNHAIAERSVIVPAMGEEELRHAIAEPAARAGHPLDEATVDLLISETEGREGALPLLQFALTRIWERMAEGVPPAETLRRIGGVGGALAGEAQRLYDKLSESDKSVARRAFLGLVRLGEGTRDTRRRIMVPDIVAYGENPDHVRKVLDMFSRPGARLITLSANPAGTDTAEVTHEALFEHWDTLRGWLDSSRDDLRFEHRLADAANHWNALGRPDGSLWRPPDLDLLRGFHERASADMTAIQIAFFQASVCKEQRTKWLKRSAIAALVFLVFGASFYAHPLWVEIRPWGFLRNLSTGTVHTLSGELVSIGRSTPYFQNLVDLRHNLVSRIHLFLKRDLSTLDMRSLTGTTVNGKPLRYGYSTKLEDQGIIVLADIAPFQFHKIEYSPFQFWTPTIRNSPPPPGWGILINHKLNSIEHLRTDCYFMSSNGEEILLHQEEPDNTLFTIRRRDNTIITIEDRKDDVHLWAVMKIGDYTYKMCKVQPGNEYSVLEWKGLDCDTQGREDDVREGERPTHSIFQATYFSSNGAHLRLFR